MSSGAVLRLCRQGGCLRWCQTHLSQNKSPHTCLACRGRWVQMNPRRTRDTMRPVAVAAVSALGLLLLRPRQSRHRSAVEELPNVCCASLIRLVTKYCINDFCTCSASLQVSRLAAPHTAAVLLAAAPSKRKDQDKYCARGRAAQSQRNSEASDGLGEDKMPTNTVQRLRGRTSRYVRWTMSIYRFRAPQMYSSSVNWYLSMGME